VSGQALSGTAKTPLWLWPNILSLDAPLIAALWQDAFARDAGVRLSLASRAALPISVWLIYLVDRLLDTAGGMNRHATARHAFYREHRGLCYLLTAFAGFLLSISLLQLPLPVMKNGLFVSCAVAVYLWIVHWRGGRWFPKEAAVGLVFAMGTVLAPFSRAADATALLPPALLFGVLCWLNCSAIEVWEGGSLDEISAWMVRHMKVVVLAICVVCLLLAVHSPRQHSSLALLMSAIGFWAFADANSHRQGAERLRVWVDIPLLTPLFLITLR
jgi:hypothetical protein